MSDCVRMYYILQYACAAERERERDTLRNRSREPSQNNRNRKKHAIIRHRNGMSDSNFVSFLGVQFQTIPDSLQKACHSSVTRRKSSA